MLLPARKRNALSAVYAFMRHADDLSDDPGMAPGERRRKLAEFIESYHRSLESGSTDDPVFLALRDSQQRYGHSHGTAGSTGRGNGHGCARRQLRRSDAPLVVYRSFDELYNYCYHVASVVGLVCIRIFGYRDPVAEQYAEHLGIAFQLTNILRDVKEDAAHGSHLSSAARIWSNSA